jgi:hypothetical protein
MVNDEITQQYRYCFAARDCFALVFCSNIAPFAYHTLAPFRIARLLRKAVL